MKSMTGYGKASHHTDLLGLEVNVRAVNGRYLDIKFYGPKIYGSIETEIRKLASQYFSRGTIEIYVNRKSYGGTESVHFNSTLAKKWLKGFNQLSKSLKLDPVKNAEILLNIPDFAKVEESSEISSGEKKVLLQTVEEAVQACSKVRNKEGKGLQKDIQAHLKGLASQAKAIKKLRVQTAKDLAEKYRQKIKHLKTEVEVDDQRLAQEIVILIDKSDISEEIQRLEAHLKAVSQLLSQTGSIGKKLDFYAQELLREVNTIGSKSTTSELTGQVVEAKSLIEKYREQVQNVE